MTNRVDFLPINRIQKQKHDRQAPMVASAKELTSQQNDWKWTKSFDKDRQTTIDSKFTSSFRHIPLVMITDTSSSNTNIVELETFEDPYHTLSDIERRLSQELRASYRPRHST